MNIKKICSFLPSYPHYKMNIFSGTNSLHEIIQTFRSVDDVVVGKYINSYSEIIKKTIGSKDIFSFASGRMGFYTILKTLNLEKGDEIIIPSFTCIVVVNAIIYAGGKPVYCDISKDDFNIDSSKVEALITKRTRVLYAQHTFGQLCAINSLMNIAKKFNLVVVEDVALALGAKDETNYAGTIGDFGYFSTDRSKVINTGLGGFVSVNNEKYKKSFEKEYEKVNYLTERVSKKIFLTFVINFFTQNPYCYWLGKFLNGVLFKMGILFYFLDEKTLNKSNIKEYPYPARLSNLQAFIGISQIKNLYQNIEYRKNVARYYNSILKIYSDDYISSGKNIFLRYSFLVNNREYWEKKFTSKIDLSIWFKTIASGRSENFEEINYNIGQNKNSEYICKHIFNLPTHNNIQPEKLNVLLTELKNSGDLITKQGIL